MSRPQLRVMVWWNCLHRLRGLGVGINWFAGERASEWDCEYSQVENALLGFQQTPLSPECSTISEPEFSISQRY